MLPTVDDSDSNKNKPKPMLLILRVFNRIKLAIASKKKVETTTMPLVDESQVLVKENIPALSNDPVQLAHYLQSNHKNQLNQKTSVIENLHTISFSYSNCVLMGNMYHFGSSRTSKTKISSTEKSILSKTSKDMMKCNDPIDTPIMRIASKYMDKDWRRIFRDLGISYSEINQIHQQHINTTSVKEIIYQLLLIWKRSSDDPSLGKLVSVLWENKQFKCVNELKMLYKQGKHQAQTRKTADTPPANTNGMKTACNGES